MKVRISDIPVEGKDFSFELERGVINDRLQVGEEGGHESFKDNPVAELNLDIEGRMVVVKGAVTGTYTAPCARCAEDGDHAVSSPVRIVLKPNSDRSRPGEEIDDLEFGFYDGREVDCVPIAEDALVEGLPFQVLCSPGCKGLCSKCGANLNTAQCRCAPESELTGGRFLDLSALKPH